MEQEIGEQIRQRFNQLDYKAVLSSWADDIATIHNQHVALFSGRDIKNWVENNEPNYCDVLPHFRPDAMAQVWQNFKEIKSALQKSDVITPFDVMSIVNPILYHYYYDAYQSHDNSYDRFTDKDKVPTNYQYSKQLTIDIHGSSSYQMRPKSRIKGRDNLFKSQLIKTNKSKGKPVELNQGDVELVAIDKKKTTNTMLSAMSSSKRFNKDKLYLLHLRG